LKTIINLEEEYGKFSEVVFGPYGTWGIFGQAINWQTNQVQHQDKGKTGLD